MPTQSSFVEAFVRSCQELAGFVAESRYQEVTTGLNRLAFDVRPELSIPERFIVHRLFIQTLAKTVASLRLDRMPEMATAFVQTELLDVSSNDWCFALHAVSAAAAGILTGARNRPDTPDTRIRRVFDVLTARYTDVNLSVRAIAKASGVSAFHLSRLVKRQTGKSLTDHLHEQRVAASRDLLLRSRLSVKEIAATVGYRSATQFGRQFRRVHHMTPLAFRSSPSREP